jgi:hypothetical protein
VKHNKKVTEEVYDEATLLLVIDQAKEKYIDQEDFVMVDKLNAILEFLPSYPLMALLEAQAQQLPNDFCEVLINTYKLKLFK